MKRVFHNLRVIKDHKIIKKHYLIEHRLAKETIFNRPSTQNKNRLKK